MDLTFDQIHEKFNKLESKRNFLLEERQRFVLESIQSENRQTAIYKVQKINQLVSERIQSKLQYRLSNLVTTALKSVFKEPEEFVVRFVLRRGKTESDLLFVKNGVDQDPIGFTGGGVLDITCFALKIAFWSLRKNRPTIIWDEPFRNVSDDLQPTVAKMLKMISTAMGIQFIIVSHEREIIAEADRSFKVELIDGISQVTQL